MNLTRRLAQFWEVREMAVPNQKVVYIGERLPRDGEHPYTE